MTSDERTLAESDYRLRAQTPEVAVVVRIAGDERLSVSRCAVEVPGAAPAAGLLREVVEVVGRRWLHVEPYLDTVAPRHRAAM